MTTDASIAVNLWNYAKCLDVRFARFHAELHIHSLFLLGVHGEITNVGTHVVEVHSSRCAKNSAFRLAELWRSVQPCAVACCETCLKTSSYFLTQALALCLGPNCGCFYSSFDLYVDSRIESECKPWTVCCNIWVAVSSGRSGSHPSVLFSTSQGFTWHTNPVWLGQLMRGVLCSPCVLWPLHWNNGRPARGPTRSLSRGLL